MVEVFDPSMHGWFLWTKYHQALFICWRDCSGFTYFSGIMKCLTSSQVLTFLYIGSSCLSLIYNKCRCTNCFTQTSQCQLMLAFPKSSCCPICPHMASVAHSVVQESFEGAFCSVLDNHFQSVSCLFWCVSQWKKQDSLSSQTEQCQSPFSYISGQGFTSSFFPLGACVGGIREHFCLAALTSTWQPLLSRLEFKKCIDGVISINWH